MKTRESRFVKQKIPRLPDLDVCLFMAIVGLTVIVVLVQWLQGRITTN